MKINIEFGDTIVENDVRIDLGNHHAYYTTARRAAKIRCHILKLRSPSIAETDIAEEQTVEERPISENVRVSLTGEQTNPTSENVRGYVFVID